MTQTAFLLSLFLPASFSIWLPRKCCQGSGGGEEASQGSLKGPFQARGKKGRLCLSFERTHTHTHESGSTSVRPPCLLLPPSFFRRFFSSSSWVVGPSVGRSRSGRHCQAGHRLLALLYGRPAYVLLSLFSISLSLLSLCPRFTSNRLLLLLFFPLPGRLRR